MRRRVVSVSLGSSTRDAKTYVRFRGHIISIERIGTDGDIDKAISLIRELDGKVQAIGLGGIDRYISIGGKRYELACSKPLVAAATKTPVVDGSALKDTLERRVVEDIVSNKLINLEAIKTFLVSGADRFGLAEALEDAGCDITYGDLLFHVPLLSIPLRSSRQLKIIGRILAPIMTRLPISMLYPTGEKQTVNTPRFEHVFARNQLIAGDFHLIHRYMPMDMSGKYIITNTVTADNIQELKDRGVKMVITTTPKFQKAGNGGEKGTSRDGNGVSRIFATNVIEAMIVAMAGKPPEEISRDDFLRYIGILGLKPGIFDFSKDTSDQNKCACGHCH